VADTKISALTSGTATSGDEVPVNRAGTNYKVTVQAIAALAPATDLTYTAATRVLASSTGTDATLPLVTSTEAGLAPLSGGGTANFLRADGTWAAPPAGAGTNLSYTAATRVLASDTGTDATLPLVSSGDAGLAPASGGGTSNFLRADGTWAAAGGGSPGGSDTHVQFNDGSAFGGDAGLTYNKTTDVLSVTGGVTLGGDATLLRDAASVVAQRAGTTAQAARVYNTYTDASNYERAVMRWTSNIFEVGVEALGTGVQRALRLKAGGGDITLSNFAVTCNNSLSLNANNISDVNHLTMAGYQQLTEMTAPAAGATNTVRIYAEDNGSGKTRLMAKFATGAAQQIAIEP
jgi:hypothetical protein